MNNILKKKAFIYFAKHGKIYSLISYVISFILNFKIHLKKKNYLIIILNKKKLKNLYLILLMNLMKRVIINQV